MYIQNLYSIKSVRSFYLVIASQDLAHSKSHTDVGKTLRT